MAKQLAEKDEEIAYKQSDIANKIQSRKTSLLVESATQAEAISQYNNQLNEHQQKAIAEEQQKRVREESFVSEKLQGLYDELAVLNVEDPSASSFWSGQDTVSKITAGIAVALGAFGAGMQGDARQNKAVQIIDLAVKRDVEQKTKRVTEKEKRS